MKEGKIQWRKLNQDNNSNIFTDKTWYTILMSFEPRGSILQNGFLGEVQF